MTRGRQKARNTMPGYVHQHCLQYERARSRYQRAKDWARVGAALGQTIRDSDRAARSASRDD